MRNGQKKNTGKPKSHQAKVAGVNQENAMAKETLLSLVQRFGAQWEQKQKELVEKHNELAAQLAAQDQLIKQVANFSAAEIGKMMAKLNMYFQSVDGALHHHDINDIAAAEMLKEIFGQLTQVEVFFRRVPGLDVSLSDFEVEQIKGEATAWFDATVKSAFAKANEMVEEQRKAVETARAQEKAAAVAAQQAKEKEQADLDEATRMEKELLQANKQDLGLAPSSGHTEAEQLGLQPDVKVFGMT